MEAARAHGFDELASTVYSNLANLDVEHGRYRAAERVLAESLPFTFERDIPICRHWQTGVRTRLQFVKGHWNAALEDASSVLDARGMPFATLWPHLVRALVPLRRGDEAQLSEVEDAWSLAERLDEPLRRLAVLAALAEVAWMTDRPDPRVSELAVAQLPEDEDLLERARLRARALLDADPELAEPEHVLLADALAARYGSDALAPIAA